eukprot:13373762-Alexandrium_andersonii.AAC.1
MCYFRAKLCRECCTGSVRSKVRTARAWALADFFHGCDSNPFALSAAAASRVEFALRLRLL